ncbi:MAG TPA: hypothetical protein PK395_17010 [bacterium]|nr:hypothetical protein [bacterium]
MRTPWGMSDSQEAYGPGITFYGTPGHGGFKVFKKLNRQIHESCRIEDGWYEEDCDWAIVAVHFPDRFPSDVMESAWKTLRNWHPKAYETITGKEIKPGESYKRDEEIFFRSHENDWVEVSHDRQEGGTVKMLAVKGGRGLWPNPKYPQGVHHPSVPKREFIVSEEEFESGWNQFGYVCEQCA